MFAEFSDPDPTIVDCLWDECFLPVTRIFTHGESINWSVVAAALAVLGLTVFLAFRVRRFVRRCRSRE